MEKNPLRILLVEDDEDDAFYIKDLILEGKTNPTPIIDHTARCDEVQDKLAKQHYDLCMFDYRLGEDNGIDLIRSIRSKKINVPIILLTGQGDQEVAVEAMKAGATDYLSKNKLSPEQLLHSIRYAIGLHKEAERRKQTELMLKESHEELTVANRELQASMEKLKSAQFQILRSEKLAGVGRLAAGVCHEILNPLNIIFGHVQALHMERNEDDTLMDDLDSITEEIHRIEKIIGGLLKFSRKGDVELSHTDINKQLESVLCIVEKEMILDGIKVVRVLNPELPLTWVDPDRLRQVFLNIINNAKFAMMEKGGKLTVFTELLILDETGSIPGTRVNGSGTDAVIRIGFTDSGVGIKKSDLNKVFDPFFTTKPEDKGTGLGLSVCYSIVEKHGGQLEVESKYGKGSTFTIDLPVLKENEEPALAQNSDENQST